MFASRLSRAFLGCGVVLLSAVACAGSTSRSGGGSGGVAGASGSGASGSAGTAGAAGNPNDTLCMVVSDCGYGEIDHEILKSSDCICLFGCPYVPLNKATIQRRAAQYQALCMPGRDGQGNPCPVDDCALPPDPQCVGGQCLPTR